jgi:hypothetical protein
MTDLGLDVVRIIIEELNDDGALVHKVGRAIEDTVVARIGVVTVEVLDIVEKQEAFGICENKTGTSAMRSSECGTTCADAPVPKVTLSMNSFIMEGASMRRP